MAYICCCRDITPLSGLVRLTRLQLSQSGVEQINALCHLTALECLFLDRCPLVPNLEHLSKLTKLAHLAISTTHRTEVGLLCWRNHKSPWIGHLDGADDFHACWALSIA